MPQDILDEFPWIQLNKKINIQESTIFCGLCKKHSSELNIREKYWDVIVRDGLKFDKKKPSDTSYLLRKHERGDQHTRVIEFLKKKAKNEVANDPIGLHMRAESKNCESDSAYVVTNRMILTIYTEGKKYVHIFHITYSTLILSSIILKLFFLHDLSLIAAWAGN